ncbi:membrane protein [Vibrio sp. JCM 19236]|nr:membrane protein [Vibrio sp. JCM 19236]
MVAIPAILVYGIGKGGLGGAVGDVVVPLMALAISPKLAASILMPILIVMDIAALKHHKRNVDWSQIKRMLPGGLAGVAIAAIFLKQLPEYGLQILIGSISVGFVCLYVFKRSATEKKVSTLGASIWCGLGGFTSTAIHAGGGPVSIYLLPQKLDKLKLIGTIVWFFAIINFTKLGVYTWLGGLSIDNLLTALVLAPLAPIGVKLGVILLHKVSQELIYKLCYIFLFISGSKLLFDGLTYI